MRKEFSKVATLVLEDLSRSWVVYFKRGRVFKPVQSISWESPPVDILKLNFDGSYIQASKRVVIGGVIRDWNGNVVRNFLGLHIRWMLMNLY